MSSKICLVLFVLVIILFLLPWFAVSCAGSTVATITVSGLDMVVGKDLPSVTGTPSSNRLDTEPLVVGVLATAVAGILASLLWKNASSARIVLGIVGIALLIAFKYKLDNRVIQEGRGILQVTYLAGYWITIIAFGAAAAVSLLKRDNSD